MIPKFRAWYTPFKGEEFGQEMKYGQAGRLITHAEMAPDKYDLMQSTGLKDKNSIEIFEGDIVLVNVSNGFDHLVNEKTVVQESEFHSGLIYKSLASGMEYRVFKHKKMDYEYEVIGNIYENSELLEEVKK
ncbi:MAG: YopX family protein [Enterococcus faecium]|nr:YopX family protein [Enterococcus faecium]